MVLYIVTVMMIAKVIKSFSQIPKLRLNLFTLWNI